jgi:hypothetical protein
MDPVGWLNGRYDRKPMQHTSYKSSKFQLEMAGVTDEMCPGPEMADENGYVMSYEEARNLVAETYPGYMQVDENCKITDWQAAKHIYHSSGMGVDISKYGFTQQELNKIRGESRYKGGGLIAYARRGYRLPPIEMVEDCFEELESKLVQEYISYFAKLLPFQYLYTDWLAEKLRPFRVNLKTYSQPTLCSDYINIELETIFGSFEPKKFIMFLKFLKFTTSLDYKTEIFDGDSYRIIIFRVKDFLDVSHSHYNSQNEYYKMQKTKDFLRDLQQNLLVKCFTDDYFKSLVTIPKLELYKCKKSKCWLTRISLLEQLFDYQYPFKYPDLFKTEIIKFNKDQYLVRFEFIRLFSTKSATKNFYLREFFQQHSVSNKRIRDIKRIFIELTQEFYQFGLINSKVKLMLHNNYIDIEDLNTFNISDGFILYEKIVELYNGLL